MSEPGKILLIELKMDGGTQGRDGLDLKTVESYAADIRRGDQLPALDVFYDGTTYWLADGFHRAAAAKEAGLIDFPVRIHQGDRDDAVLHSAGANKCQGLRRTNEDKRRQVEALLRNEKWSKMSNRAIADHIGVSLGLVNDMRHEIDDGTTERIVQSKDGRQMNVTNIAASSSARAEERAKERSAKEKEGREPPASTRPTFTPLPMAAAPAGAPPPLPGFAPAAAPVALTPFQPGAPAASAEGQVLASVAAPPSQELKQLKELIAEQRMLNILSRRTQERLDQVYQAYDERGEEPPLITIEQGHTEEAVRNLTSSTIYQASVGTLAAFYARVEAPPADED